MDDPRVVRRGKSIGHLRGNVKQLAWRVDGCDRCPVHQFHDQIVRSDVIELADIGVVERGDCAGFVLEPFAERLLRDLDGDGATEARIASLVHFAHPADTEQCHDLVGTKTFAGMQGHGQR